MTLQEIISAAIIISGVFLLIFTLTSIPRLVYNKKFNPNYIEGIEKALKMTWTKGTFFSNQGYIYPIEMMVFKPMYVEYRSTRFLLQLEYAPLNNIEKQIALVETLSKKHGHFKFVGNAIRMEKEFIFSPPSVDTLKADFEAMTQIAISNDLKGISKEKSDAYCQVYDEYLLNN